MKVYAGVNSKENMELAIRLGAPAILTNANVILSTYGKDKTLKECTQMMLDQARDIPVFTSVHGKDYKAIVEKSLDLCSLSPRLGVKIVSSKDGFQAMKILSEKGIRCIATGMYTTYQAIMAAQVGAFAISPFIARGMEYGLDMEETLRTIRSIYDRMECPPEILAASIRTMKDIDIAIRTGSDGLAIGYDLIDEMIKSEYTDLTEKSFGKAFSMMKGEDVSYLDLEAEEKPESFVE